MKLFQVKEALTNLEHIGFQLPNGTFVPNHFHVTEVGKVTKHFIDCGGVVREEEVVNFQLWNAMDYDHRLHPEKLMDIIELAEKTLYLNDVEVEVEYQGATIEKYNLAFDGTNFLLKSRATGCLAPDKCGIPEEQLPKESVSSCCGPNDKPKVKLSDLQKESTCEPGSECC